MFSAQKPEQNSIAFKRHHLLASVAACSLFILTACEEKTDSAAGGDSSKQNQPIVSEEEGESAAPEPSRKEVYIDLTAQREALAATKPMPEAPGLMAPPPMAGDIDRERYEDFEENPVKVVKEEPVSTFSVDVDTAAYSVTRRFLNQGNIPPNDAVRVEELINYFDYDYAVPENKSEPFQANTYLYQTPWNPGTQLLHIGIKGYDIEREKRSDSNLVLLLDVSGSMDSSDKLPLLKQAMRMLVKEMGANDTVSIVVYAGAAGTVLEPTKGSERSKILGALDRLDAGGSTAGGEGIRQAYALAQQNFKEGAVNRVILATDGDFNVGINDPERLEDFVAAKRDTGVFLTVLGFGQGNYHDALMQKLAQAGNGNAAYIDSVKEARKVLVDEMAGTLFTIAKDVKIQVEFNPAQITEYRLIGYETRVLNREDFNNDKVDAGDIGSGHSVTAIYELVPKDSDARLTDPLRYGDKSPANVAGPTEETAFVRIRYKLPDEEHSKLIETSVKTTSLIGTVDKAPSDIQFAAAVAAFGQKLKGGRYLEGYSYENILSLAQNAKGPDPFGYRAEFTQLIRLAESADVMPSLESHNSHVTQ